jgi:hypothetical protein
VFGLIYIQQLYLGQFAHGLKANEVTAIHIKGFLDPTVQAFAMIM